MRFKWIKEQIDADAKIVDIGSNKGHTFYHWPKKENVTNVDIDLYDTWNFVRASADDLPFEDNSYDVAVLAEILEHVPDPVKVLKEAKRVAKRLLITVPFEYIWPENLDPLMSIEDKEKKEGKTRLEMAKEANPAKEFYMDDNLNHLWHVRFYTEETIKKDIEEAGLNIESCELLKDGGFAWYCIVAK